MLRIFAMTAMTISLISCSGIPLSPQDARDIYLGICLTDSEKARLKKTRALDRSTLEKIIRNNENFRVKC